MKHTASTAKRTKWALAACVALPACAPHPDNGAVCSAYSNGTSGIEVVAQGTVARLLGARAGFNGDHEGFVMRLDSACALSVRIEINTNATGPVPLRRGEAVVAKGEFDLDRDGGVIHWTHRAFGSRHQSGYIQAGGRTYW